MERDSVISSRILDDMTDGVVAIDLSGRIITFNPAAVDILGIQQADALARTFGEVFLLAEENDDFNQTILDAIYESSTSHNRVVPFTNNGKRTILLPDHHLSQVGGWCGPEDGGYRGLQRYYRIAGVAGG